MFALLFFPNNNKTELNHFEFRFGQPNLNISGKTSIAFNRSLPMLAIQPDLHDSHRRSDFRALQGPNRMQVVFRALKMQQRKTSIEFSFLRVI